MIVEIYFLMIGAFLGYFLLEVFYFLDTRRNCDIHWIISSRIMKLTVGTR